MSVFFQGNANARGLPQHCDWTVVSQPLPEDLLHYCVNVHQPKVDQRGDLGWRW